MYRTGTFDGDLYLDAADQLGLRYELMSIPGSWYRIYSQERELLVHGHHLGCNNVVATNIARNKQVTSTLLRTHNIPVPEQHMFRLAEDRRSTKSIEAAVDFASRRYPVVVKSLAGSLSMNVFVNIEDDDSLIAILEKLRQQPRNRYLIENQVAGLKHRILVARDEVVDVYVSHPKTIIGDGRSRIKDIIASHRVYDVMTGRTSPIAITDRVLRNLGQSGLELNSVLESGQQIVVDPIGTTPTGGTTKRINIQSIPDETLSMWRRAKELVGLDVAGIDFLSPDITVGWSKIPCAINEVNASPFLRGHFRADGGHSLSAPLGVLRALFFNGSPDPKEGSDERI